MGIFKLGASMCVPITLALSGCSESLAPTASIAAAPTVPGNWELVWADEFDGDTLDTRRWAAFDDCWGGGNDERQCYTPRRENIAVRNGKLMLNARSENWTGPAWPASFDRDTEETASKVFTSGKIASVGLASWTYGKFEMRARLPQGQGVWPAFWMMPEESVYGGWPRSGEIDILETVNLGVECSDCEEGGENSILGTLHFGDQRPGNRYINREISYPDVLDDAFHTFGVIWQKGQFTWTIDGKPYGSIADTEWFTAASDDAQAPFDKRFHLILNLAIGGNWPENTALGGVSDDNFPKTMEVDWVRVWQCDADPATGQGCTRGQ